MLFEVDLHAVDLKLVSKGGKQSNSLCHFKFCRGAAPPSANLQSATNVCYLPKVNCGSNVMMASTDQSDLY